MQMTKKPLRVLMVTGVYPTEQRPHSGTFIKSQADSLVDAGFEVEVIHPRSGPVLVRYAVAALSVFLKTLTRRFDIVHGHYGLWCLAAGMQWTTAVVASFLGDDLLGTPTAGGGYSKKAALVVRVSRWLCRHVGAVIVKSEQMRKAAGKGDIAVIPNGVDFELFRPVPREAARAALGWDQSQNYILFGADPIIPRKNYALAREAVERLRARGIAAQLVVANGLPQTKVVLAMNASNTLLLTSLSEGSPNIVKETMACNVPVVSVDVGDVPMVIGRTEGCKVCPRDPDALAAGLEEALQHTAPTTGRTDIMHLNRAVVVEQVTAVYKQAMCKKRKTLREPAQSGISQ